MDNMLEYQKIINLVSKKCDERGCDLRSRQITALAESVVEVFNEEFKVLCDRLDKLENIKKTKISKSKK
jgi:chromosomal replication initiation ATPase DnaA